MQTRKRRGSKGNDNSDEISFDSSSESGEKSASDFSDDGVKTIIFSTADRAYYFDSQTLNTPNTTNC